MSDREKKLLVLASAVIGVLLLRGVFWPAWSTYVEEQEFQAKRLAKQVQLFEQLVQRSEARTEDGQPAAEEKESWETFRDGFYDLKAAELASADLQREIQAAASEQGLTLTLIDVPEVVEFDSFRMFSVRFAFGATLPQLLNLLKEIYEAEHRLMVPALEVNFREGGNRADVEVTVSGFQYLDDE